MENKDVMKTGTTTLGMVCKDGIVMAADSRATAGNFIANKKTQKIVKVNKNIAVTIAGTASDAKMLSKLLTAELNLKKIRTGRDPTVKEAATLLGGMVYNNLRSSFIVPGITHFLVGGVDQSGIHLYDVEIGGMAEEIDDYLSSGSGSYMVYGILESSYKKEMSIDEGINMAVKCVSAAIQRDSASGNSINVIRITEKGVEDAKHVDMNVKVQ
jgi:proteasome beta subunit